MTDCNKCYLSMQNCHDASIACESEEYNGERCDWFEPLEDIETSEEIRD